MNRSNLFYGNTDGQSVVSVGERLGSTVYNTKHATYQRIVGMVNEKVVQITARESARRIRAVPSLVTTVLDTQQRERLSHDYPEFKLVHYEFERPGHAMYVAQQSMANELIMEEACRLTATVTHLGGSLLGSLVKSGVDIHLEMNAAYRAAVHARNRDTSNVARVMSDYAKLAEDIGANDARSNYEKYLRREAYVTCGSSQRCCKQSDAFCADLSTYNMSPNQFCAAMVQIKAQVGFGFFPYTPLMLVTDVGEIEDTGVRFDKTGDLMEFHYPEGVMGIEVMPLRDWAAWLCEHVIHIGRGASRQTFHIQLSKARGPFMFFQVTKVSGEDTVTELRHALDLPMYQKQYVVKSATLRNLAADPALQSSWERVVFTVPAKTVDGLFAFGMQLSPENFDRYALRKQMKILDRVTIEGSVVTKTGTLSSTQIDLLVTAIHARLFVMRYESGQLSKQLMDRLRKVAQFGSAGFWARVSAVASWGLANLWDSTFGVVADALSSLCAWLEDRFSKPAVQLPVMTMAPEYIAFETISDVWRHTRADKYTEAIRAVETMSVVGDAYHLKGSLIANALASVQKEKYDGSAAAAKFISDIAIPDNHVHSVDVASIDVNDIGQESTGAADFVPSEQQDALIEQLRKVNAFDEPPVDRHSFPVEAVVRMPTQTESMRQDYDPDPDAVGTLNEVYESFNPGVAQEPLWRDMASLSYDDQDRSLHADFLRLPRLMDIAPKDRSYYMSRIHALGAPKRQETTQELLSSVAARNLAAPKISLPQDYSVLIPQIWDNFIDTMCVAGARDKLKSYASDPVALEEDAFRQWVAKAKMNNFDAVKRQVEEEAEAFDEMPVGDYLMMLKADVKPPLSDKPLRGRIEPQVIVYHKKALSAMYSSIFRVLVRRFLSLLRPEIHVNLLKDSRDIAATIRALHPFGAKLKYLENDFSKYDKSQDEFVFQLESYVFLQLGMNHALLTRWLNGHTDCNIRSVNTGISLRLRFQRKSGDATTAFGNVLLNIMSVAYAYQPSGIAWGVFMGDDSLLACHAVGNEDKAVMVLAEVFNLTAKMYVTDAPYFASNFVVIDETNNHVELVPDPIKRIEKWSQPVAADDPQWKERFISAADSCKPYMYKFNTHPLAKLVASRYPISLSDAERLPSAIATIVSGPGAFRHMYEEHPQLLNY